MDSYVDSRRALLRQRAQELEAQLAGIQAELERLDAIAEDKPADLRRIVCT